MENGRLLCMKCGGEITKKQYYCVHCFLDQQWEITQLQEIKKIIDKIIERSKLNEKCNPYNKDDYEHLF